MILSSYNRKRRSCLDDAVRILLPGPLIGIKKVGDLVNIRVYKFRMIDQLVLLAYKKDS